MTDYIQQRDRHVKKTRQNKAQPEFPLLYKPRPLKMCGDLGTDDARWRGVPKRLNFNIANRTRVHEMQMHHRTR